MILSLIIIFHAAHIRSIRIENEEVLNETDEDREINNTEILSQIDIFRQNLLDVEDAGVKASETSDTLLNLAARIYPFYEKHLTDNNQIDFERMIQYAIKILDQDAKGNKQIVKKYEHVLVDEFQDINFSQKKMMDRILEGGAKYWVVGDDDQAIYGWRGSDVKFILEFEQDYPGAKKVNLKQNYRSGRSIVYLAKELASYLTSRHDKMLTAVTEAKGQARIFDFANEETEASGVVDLIRSRKKQASIIMKLLFLLELINFLQSSCKISTSRYSLFYKRWIRFIFGQIFKAANKCYCYKRWSKFG